MYPLVLLLLLGAGSSESTGHVPYDTVGLNFTVVFPENIASYYPRPPTNMVIITALKNGTKVHIQEYGILSTKWDMKAGDVWNFTANATLELGKQNISNKILTIYSDNDITVQAISRKEDSLQTAVVIPTDKLGKTYLIPPIPTIPGTNFPNLVVQMVTERGPFRIIIVNGVQEQNNVSVRGLKTQEVSLQSGEVAQIWLNESAGFKYVTANNTVAVLFGHPCAMKGNCSCGMLYTILPPAPNRTLKYLVPPFLAQGAEGETKVLLAQNDSTNVTTYVSSSLTYDVAGTAILYRPGLLLPLIPTENFACCFVVTALPGTSNNYAVIVVSSNVTDGVRVGKKPIHTYNAVWKNLEGTHYSSAQVPLNLGKTVIWHTSSKMAVYFSGNNGSTLFGNQAPVISSSPDFRGCAVTPEVLDFQEPSDWRNSFQTCTLRKLELLCLSSTDLQKQIYGKLNQNRSLTDTVQQMWIGMRRSSVNGEWFWVNGDNVSSTTWGDGEPGGVEEGKCTIMSLGNGTGVEWSDNDCCMDAHYICYKEPELFPI